MKLYNFKFFFVFYFVITLFNCKTEEIITNEVNPNIIKPKEIKNSFLSFNHLESFFPSVYFKENGKITFKNLKNEELVFYVNHRKKTGPMVNDSIPYTAEYIKMRMETADKKHFILFSLDVVHLSKGIYSPTEFLTFYMNKPILHNDITVYFNEEKKLLQIPLYRNPVSTKTINGKEYTDVFVSESNKPEYSALYYNGKFGVLGFKDDKNELWHLDRFE